MSNYPTLKPFCSTIRLLVLKEPQPNHNRKLEFMTEDFFHEKPAKMGSIVS